MDGVFDVHSVPRRELIGDLAERAAEKISVPWRIQVRTGPDAEIAGIAAAHGLGSVARSPFMVRGLDGPGAALGGPLPAAFVVRQLGSGGSAEFAAALAAGFEAPAQVMNRLGSAEILALPGATGYLAEADGAVVATGLALRAGGCVGIFNISVPPERRRQGYGAAVTSAILAAAREWGTRLAFLHSSAMGRSVYECLGFRTVEKWTRYT
ncbi:GNAT family N-acetyltransferase [Streptomyces sp. MB22_4]|uniref:GNAT family N-acetyltransferase n=1 Tax=Streptomyces sp. MB22_4 TaxID=3383120 RepID=UPI0039A0AAF0